MGGVFAGLVQQRTADKRAQFKKALIHFEAKIGGQLFGQVADGRRREFFCLDEYTWVWHEEWTDQNGQRQVVTTRYDVRPTGILKSQGHMQYQALTPEEKKNFCQAVRQYRQRVEAEYRRMLGQQV